MNLAAIEMDLVVTPAWLAGELASPRLRVIDVRVDPGERPKAARFVMVRGGMWTRAEPVEGAGGGLPSVYLAGHVPGAVSLDVGRRLFDREGAVECAPEVARAMSALGVGDEHTVVVVDETLSSTAKATVWALAKYGHRRVRALAGGLARWKVEGRALSRALEAFSPASFTARVAAAESARHLGKKRETIRA